MSYSFFNRVNGHKAVTAIAMQLPGSNATEAVQAIEETLNSFDGRLPAGLKINVAQSVNEFLFASIYEVI